jgi:hypothetical protein
MKWWLGQEVIDSRIALADEIISIETKTITTLRQQMEARKIGVSYVKDEIDIPFDNEGFFPSTPDTPHS